MRVQKGPSCYCPKCEAEILICLDDEGFTVSPLEGGSGSCWASLVIGSNDLAITGPCPLCAALLKIIFAEGRNASITIQDGMRQP